MKLVWFKFLLITACVFCPFVDATQQTQPAEQFSTTIQMGIYETSPKLTERSKRMVVNNFSHSLANYPELKGRVHKIRTVGNEVIFSVYSDRDVRPQMDHFVRAMIGGLNGKANTRGRMRTFRTTLGQPIMGSLDVVVASKPQQAPYVKKIVSISTESVPLSDLLKELRMKLGSFGYLVPGECMHRTLGWSFGQAAGTGPQPLSVAMKELATFLGLRVRKQNESFIFTGACQNQPARPTPPSGQNGQLVRAFLPVHTGAAIRPTRVQVPLMPLEHSFW